MKTLLLFILSVSLVSAQTTDGGATRAPVGKSITLTVTADGTPPLTYQWLKDGVAMAGKTTDKLVLSPFSVEHVGIYHAVVANEAGSTQSNRVQLVPVKAPTKSTITVNIAVGTVNP